MVNKWREIIDRRIKVDNRSGEEIAKDIIEKAGLKFG